MDKNKYLILGSIVAAITGVPSAYYLTGVSPHGEQAIAQHEGYRAKPYRDPGGVVTQGHGSTFRPDGSRIKMTDKAISKKEALHYLHAHIARHQKVFNHSLRNIRLSQTEYDIYADFVYQYGIDAWKESSMLRHLHHGQYVQACRALEKWRFSRVGKVKVDCRLNSKCRGVWNRQKWRIEKCLEANQ